MALRLKDRMEKRREEARLCLDRKADFESRCGFGSYTQNLAKWDIQWRGRMDRYNRPWPHASDYNPPVTFSKVEDVHAILYGFVSGFDFFTVAAAAKSGNADEIMRKRAQDWTDLLRWSLQNESNSSAFLDRFTHDGITYGSGFGSLSWFRACRKIRSEIFIPDELRADEKSADTTIIKAALGEDLKRGIKKRDSESWDICFVDDDGEEKDGIAWVDRDNPFRPEGEPVLVVERDAVWYEAPRPRNIAPWDILVPPDALDLQTCRRFWVRERMGYDEISRLCESGVFNAISRDDLKDLREKASRKNPALSGSSGSHDTVDAIRDTDLGTTKISSSSDLFEVIFEYCFEDVDDDGYEESIIRAVINFGKPILAMRHRLEYLFPHGRRPVFDWHYIPVDNRYYGMGIPELLERTQMEANCFYQSRNDVLEIITKPGGMYDPMSGLAPNEITYTPGMMVKVRDPATAFRPFVFPVDPTHLLREQSGAEVNAEKAIGSTDMGLGRSSGRPNAPRTLGGTALMVRQQQLRMDVSLKRLMYGSSPNGPGGINEFLLQYRELYQAFMPQQKEFRTLGTNEMRAVQRSDLQGRYDNLIDFGQEINNPQLRMQNAVLRYQNSLNNPLVMQNPQALWQVTVDLWEASGKKNAARILPPPQPGASHPPMSQEEEFAVMGKGIFIEVLPNDNHQEHLQVIQQLIQDPMHMAQSFGPAEIPLLDRHAQKHMEFAMATSLQAGGAMGGGVPPGSPGVAPAGQTLPPAGSPRNQRVQTSMGGVMPRETMAGPIETDVERGLVP